MEKTFHLLTCRSVRGLVIRILGGTSRVTCIVRLGLRGANDDRVMSKSGICDRCACGLLDVTDIKTNLDMVLQG